MSVIAHLEAQLRADPHHETSWLVYADWLTDQDDERGELIRLAHTRTGPDERARIAERVAAIEARGRQQWLAGLPPSAVLHVEWQYGFARAVSLRGTLAVEALVDLLRHPSARLLLEVRCSGLDPRWVEPLVALLPGSGIRAFGIRGADLRVDTLASLCPAFEGLAELEITDCALNRHHATTLTSARSLGALKALDLRHNELDDASVRALAAATDTWPQLATLQLGTNGIGPRGARALADGAATAFPSLRTLDLGNNEVGPVGAEALARSDGLRGLVGLSLDANQLGPAGGAALAAHGAFPALRRLDLGSNDLGAQGGRDLAAARWPLTELRCAGNGFRSSATIEALLGLRLDELLVLDLGWNRLGDAAAKKVARAEALGNLEELGLAGNAVGRAGVLALAGSPHLGRLDRVDLSANPVGPAAADLWRASGNDRVTVVTDAA